jgi:hypothetical protein
MWAESELKLFESQYLLAQIRGLSLISITKTFFFTVIYPWCKLRTLFLDIMSWCRWASSSWSASTSVAEPWELFWLSIWGEPTCLPCLQIMVILFSWWLDTGCSWILMWSESIPWCTPWLACLLPFRPVMMIIMIPACVAVTDTWIAAVSAPWRRSRATALGYSWHNLFLKLLLLVSSVEEVPFILI